MNSLQSTNPARLHSLHITSAGPDRLVDFYQRMLDMHAERCDCGIWTLEGPARRLLVSEGPSSVLVAIAYALPDAASLARLREGIEVRGGATKEALSPYFGNDAFAVRDPQQRQMIFGVPLESDSTLQGAPGRLQHVVFQTTKLDEVVAFYTAVVGFTISDEVVGEDGKVMVCFMRSDDEHHSLAFFRGSRNEWDHHCYETPEWNSIRDWGDRFAKQRVPIFFGPGRHGPGNNLFFMVNDPDGNRLEFSAELERVESDRPPGIWPHDEYTLNSWGRAWMRS